MNNSQRAAAFNKALTAQLKIRRDLSTQATDELIALLQKINEQITVTLSRQPGDYQRWFLPQIMSQIETILHSLQQQGTSALNLSLDKSAEAGLLQLDNALRPAGISIAGVTPVIDTTMLVNIKNFHVNRIKDITNKAAGAIELELSKVLVGAQTPFEAMQAVTDLMTDSPTYRIRAIVRTSMASVYDKSAQDRYEQASDVLPGLKKRWYQSGKRHPRLTHVLAHHQTVAIDEQFVIGQVKMMHPHDPKAPPAEVISCGCHMRPYMENWETKQPAQTLTVVA